MLYGIYQINLKKPTNEIAEDTGEKTLEKMKMHRNPIKEKIA